jgi:hypothetical protein
MNRLLTFVAILSLILTTSLFAQQNFQRAFQIPTSTYEEGGFGGIIAGVDFDGDGMPEFYACNTNMIDRPGELIPRMYKFEWNGTDWEMVWSVTTEIPLQNTWPALAMGDVDEDGKPEIYWGPVNYLDASTNPNPPRVIVYEYPGDGSDNMGVDDGFGGFLPNASFTITDVDMTNLRPIRFIIEDIDSDGTDEIIFADRAASSADWHFGVLSVDDIPDDGSGLETWTIEASGLGDFVLAGTGNKWDLAVLDNYIYLFDGIGQLFPVRYQGGVWETLPPQAGLAGDASSFKGATVVDIDDDGTKEIVVGSWFGGAKVYVLQQVADTLQSFEIADLSTLGGYRLNGIDFGDLDSDGNLDFVIGSRHDALNTVNNPVFRVEYQGGDITDPNNYVSSMIDSLLLTTGGDLDVIVVANIDGDTDDEVLYTQGYTRGNPTDEPADIPILDLNFTPPVGVERENSGIPANFYVEQNYPNPFNPSTVIRFGITEATSVDLRVYDVLGREVAVLVSNQNLEAGSYTANFNAEGLSSGIYVYRITAGNNTTSMKMQLLK